MDRQTNRKPDRWMDNMKTVSPHKAPFYGGGGCPQIKMSNLIGHREKL